MISQIRHRTSSFEKHKTGAKIEVGWEKGRVKLQQKWTKDYHVKVFFFSPNPRKSHFEQGGLTPDNDQLDFVQEEERRGKRREWKMKEEGCFRAFWEVHSSYLIFHSLLCPFLSSIERISPERDRSRPCMTPSVSGSDAHCLRHRQGVRGCEAVWGYDWYVTHAQWQTWTNKTYSQKLAGRDIGGWANWKGAWGGTYCSVEPVLTSL